MLGRNVVLAAMALTAMTMYLDRACFSQVSDIVAVDLDLNASQSDWILGAFFWSYALAQVPAARLGVRFGQARMLAIYVVAWSAFTMLVGAANGFVALFAARLLVGLAEAGAYPCIVGILRDRFPVQLRGKANSVAAFGGRFGWALAQILTPVFVVTFTSASTSGWRITLVLYGLFGFVVAVILWAVARTNENAASSIVQVKLILNSDEPPGSSRRSDLLSRGVRLASSREETEVASSGASPEARRLPVVKLRTGDLVRSTNLWACSLVLFCTNLGWAFLLTKLPVYLTEVYQVPLAERGLPAALPAWLSCLGMLGGGVLTDAMLKRFGVRRSRSWPIAAMMALGAVAFLIAPTMPSYWGFVIVLSVMAVGVDLANPSIWSFAQDVGGSNAATVLGWCNMWGNLGAACSPVVWGLAKQHLGWDAAFFGAAAAFAVAAMAALAMNAAVPVRPRMP